MWISLNDFLNQKHRSQAPGQALDIGYYRAMQVQQCFRRNAHEASHASQATSFPSASRRQQGMRPALPN